MNLVKIRIRFESYSRREFFVDVVRYIIIPLIPLFRLIVRAYRPIAIFLEEVVSAIKKILLFIIVILFGFISMIVIFGNPLIIIYGMMTQK